MLYYVSHAVPTFSTSPVVSYVHHVPGCRYKVSHSSIQDTSRTLHGYGYPHGQKRGRMCKFDESRDPGDVYTIVGVCVGDVSMAHVCSLFIIIVIVIKCRYIFVGADTSAIWCAGPGAWGSGCWRLWRAAGRTAASAGWSRPCRSLFFCKWVTSIRTYDACVSLSDAWIIEAWVHTVHVHVGARIIIIIMIIIIIIIIISLVLLSLSLL